jgi:hypothetical protein
MLLTAVLPLSAYSLRAATNVDAAFKAFWDAPSTAAAEKAVRASARAELISMRRGSA